jgi:hypothetical protein
MEIKVKEFIDIEVDGINTGDAPDFCDAYINSATAVLEDGSMRDATEDELRELSDDSDLVYEYVLKRIY